ncbi:MAG: response regulator [Elusimicrobia bacterium]|nr:response regulator [Elusimicrobiota bacterium]
MENEEGRPEPVLSDPKEKLILLVDDDEDVLDILEHVARQEGFRTDRAVDGPEALRKAEALMPDLILLDFMLPGKGGYEVLRELQATGNGGIPIIVITGRNLDENQVAMVRREPNVKEFLIKPMRPAALSALIHSILQTRPPAIDRTARGRPMTGGF